jgi:hypothetical protein
MTDSVFAYTNSFEKYDVSDNIAEKDANFSDWNEIDYISTASLIVDNTISGGVMSDTSGVKFLKIAEKSDLVYSFPFTSSNNYDKMIINIDYYVPVGEQMCFKLLSSYPDNFQWLVELSDITESRHGHQFINFVPIFDKWTKIYIEFDYTKKTVKIINGLTIIYNGPNLGSIGETGENGETISNPNLIYCKVIDFYAFHGKTSYYDNLSINIYKNLNIISKFGTYTTDLATNINIYQYNNNFEQYASNKMITMVDDEFQTWCTDNVSPPNDVAQIVEFPINNIISLPFSTKILKISETSDLVYKLPFGSINYGKLVIGVNYYLPIGEKMCFKILSSYPLNLHWLISLSNASLGNYTQSQHGSQSINFVPIFDAWTRIHIELDYNNDNVKIVNGTTIIYNGPNLGSSEFDQSNPNLKSSKIINFYACDMSLCYYDKFTIKLYS